MVFMLKLLSMSCVSGIVVIKVSEAREQEGKKSVRSEMVTVGNGR